MSLFVTHQLIRRTGGGFVRGEAKTPTEYPAVDFAASIQPGTPNDYEQMAATPFGRREAVALFRIYTTEKLNFAGEENDGGVTPGDIVLYNGKRLLVIGEADRTEPASSVSHYRYLAVREIKQW